MNWAQSRGYHGYETVRSMGASGNEIVVYRKNSTNSHSTVIFIPGLLSSVSSVAHLADEYHELTGTECVLYNRAGYGASRVGSARPFSLSEAVEDAVEMISSTVDKDRSVHLVGHSMGGLLAHRLAHRLPDRIASVTLLDPTHPYELRHSKAQYVGAEGLDLTLMLGPATMRMGGALLLSRKQVMAFAEGNRYRDRIWFDVAASKIYHAARREWSYLHPLMLDWPSAVETVNIPLTLIAAGDTLDSIPRHRELFDQYVDAGTPGYIYEVADAGHLTLVTEVRFIRQICEIMAADHLRNRSI
ncbi:alpha/beta fold hydrolase [Glutamicibacter ardleyensis]|uniref:alpha/beta fold hydrolase n=1 Tax=Glutamicibacter ardleyensis TaxID=225894 RepID=UPI003FD56C38